MNFSPEQLRAAQEQMARMTPSQMAEMQKMAASMDPAVAASMGVNAAQLRQASEAMASMSADDMAKASEQARHASRRGGARSLLRRALVALTRCVPDEKHEPRGHQASDGGCAEPGLSAAAVLLQRAAAFALARRLASLAWLAP